MSYIHTVNLPASNQQADLEHGSLFFIGTATLLLRFAGFTILTDPNFLHQGDHIHLGYGLQAVRQTNPAIEINELPPLDAVILSHMHEDHFDRIAARKLQKNLPIVTTPQAAKALGKKHFFRTYPLKTWETLSLEKGDALLTITAMPGEHAPGLLSHLLPPVMGSMLEFQNARRQTILRIYITGDTLIHKALKDIPRRYPDIDLAILHLGGTKFYGLMLTMDAKQGVEAIKLINPHEAIPVHYDDYNVFRSPLADFQQAVTNAGLNHRVRYLKRGDTYNITAPQQSQRTASNIGNRA
jgi:L-ascorbate metabolism protein UlaG (beta-lactamase superfamily)